MWNLIASLAVSSDWVICIAVLSFLIYSREVVEFVPPIPIRLLKCLFPLIVCSPVVITAPVAKTSAAVVEELKTPSFIDRLSPTLIPPNCVSVAAAITFAEICCWILLVTPSKKLSSSYEIVKLLHKINLNRKSLQNNWYQNI